MILFLELDFSFL